MLLRQIQYLMTIAEYKHFTRAAERLFISQSALSQQITKLENGLGVKLINREQHPVELTPAGHDFVRCAERVQESVARLERSMRKHLPLEQRTIRLGMITGLGSLDIAGLLTAFSNQYPDINYTITNNLSKGLCKMLSDETIDLAILAAPYDIDDYHFELFPMQDEEFVLITPENHPFAEKNEIMLAEAKDERFIFPTPENVSYDIFTNECQKAGFSPKIISECNGPGRRLDLVKAGLGIALISQSGLDYYNSPGICCVRLHVPFYKRIVLARAKRKDISMIQTTLWQYIQQYKHVENAK